MGGSIDEREKRRQVSGSQGRDRDTSQGHENRCEGPRWPAMGRQPESCSALSNDGGRRESAHNVPPRLRMPRQTLQPHWPALAPPPAASDWPLIHGWNAISPAVGKHPSYAVIAGTEFFSRFSEHVFWQLLSSLYCHATFIVASSTCAFIILLKFNKWLKLDTGIFFFFYVIYFGRVFKGLYFLSVVLFCHHYHGHLLVFWSHLRGFQIQKKSKVEINIFFL